MPVDALDLKTQVNILAGVLSCRCQTPCLEFDSGPGGWECPHDNGTMICNSKTNDVECWKIFARTGLGYNNNVEE